MKIKIHNSADRPGLCKSCENSFIVEYDNREKYTYCRGVGLDSTLLVTRKVIKCSRYSEEKPVGLWDMRQIAWVLRTDSAGSKIGFKRYSDLGEKERQEIDDL